MDEASAETTDPVAAEVVHVTIPITAPPAEVKGGTVSASDDADIRRVLSWNIVYQLGQLTGVPVGLDADIPLSSLQRILAEIKQMLFAAGK